jgi:hypothetical protein
MKCQSFPCFAALFALTLAWEKALDLAQGVKAAINTQPLAANY